MLKHDHLCFLFLAEYYIWVLTSRNYVVRCICKLLSYFQSELSGHFAEVHFPYSIQT